MSRLLHLLLTTYAPLAARHMLVEGTPTARDRTPIAGRARRDDPRAAAPPSSTQRAPSPAT